jgi:tetratricopeptide (TPR) repeat protein
MSNLRASFGFIASFALLTAPASLPAQAPADDGWVGKEVVQKASGFVLKLNDGVVRRTRAVAAIYRVEHIEGPRLRLRAPGVEGSASADEVVSVDRAIEHFTAHIRTNPNDSFAYSMRAMIRQHLRKEIDSVLGDCNEAIRLNPRASQGYVNRGAVWHENKEYDRAIADYGEAIRLDPEDDVAYQNRGLAWAEKRDYDRAVADFGEAIRIDPGSAPVYYDRGLVWYEKRDYDRAVADYSEAIRLDPRSAVAYCSRGTAWLAQKEYDRAIADYSEAIRLDPSDAAAYSNRGNAWLAKKEYDRAVGDHREAIRLDSKCAAAYSNRGTAWLAQKEYDRAIADYGEAIRLEPKLAAALHNRGFVWFIKKEYDRAIADYGEAIRLDPKEALGYCNRGDAWLAQKEYDRAVADYNEAIRLDPKYPWHHYGLAVVSLVDDGRRAEPEARVAIEIGGWRGDRAVYAAIIGSLGSRRAKQDLAATRLLDDAAGKCDTSAWPYPVVRFLRREIDEKALLDLAIDDDKRTEARSFLGLDHALAGHPEEARGQFVWVKEHGITQSTQYTIALAELDRLDARPKP